MGFPKIYGWSAYVTPKCPKWWFRKRIFVFLNKIEFQSNKVCYKVPYSENFQRQSCSTAIPLLKSIDIGAKSNLSI